MIAQLCHSFPCLSLICLTIHQKWVINVIVTAWNKLNSSWLSCVPWAGRSGSPQAYIGSKLVVSAPLCCTDTSLYVISPHSEWSALDTKIDSSALHHLRIWYNIRDNSFTEHTVMAIIKSKALRKKCFWFCEIER